MLSSTTLQILVGGAVLIAVTALTLIFPNLGGPRIGYAVVGVYLLTISIGITLWLWRDRSLGFRTALMIAITVVIVLFPLTPRLFVFWGDSSPSVIQYWALSLPLHLRWFVPLAFMFPLGAATTRPQQLGTLGIMVLPSLYELADWFVLNPEQFDPFWTTPGSLLVSTVFWFAVLIALASPLFLIGRELSSGNTGFVEFLLKSQKAG